MLRHEKQMAHEEEKRKRLELGGFTKDLESLSHTVLEVLAMSIVRVDELGEYSRKILFNGLCRGFYVRGGEISHTSPGLQIGTNHNVRVFLLVTMYGEVDMLLTIINQNQVMESPMISRKGKDTYPIMFMNCSPLARPVSAHGLSKAAMALSRKMRRPDLCCPSGNS